MKIISHSQNQTLNIGRLIAKNLKPADIICLFGDLGSGKTVLAKGIAAGLGVKPKQVISPTFVLIRQHKARNLLFNHFDLYRLKNKCQIIDLGYEEYFYADGVSVVEWADRLGPLLPKEFLKISLKLKSKNKRGLEFMANGRRYEQLLQNFRKGLKS